MRGAAFEKSGARLGAAEPEDKEICVQNCVCFDWEQKVCLFLGLKWKEFVFALCDNAIWTHKKEKIVSKKYF